MLPERRRAAANRGEFAVALAGNRVRARRAAIRLSAGGNRVVIRARDFCVQRFPAQTGPRFVHVRAGPRCWADAATVAGHHHRMEKIG